MPELDVKEGDFLLRERDCIESPTNSIRRRNLPDSREEPNHLLARPIGFGVRSNPRPYRLKVDVRRKYNDGSISIHCQDRQTKASECVVIDGTRVNIDDEGKPRIDSERAKIPSLRKHPGDSLQLLPDRPSVIAGVLAALSSPRITRPWWTLEFESPKSQVWKSRLGHAALWSAV
jgi:hypothetical protein